MYLADYHVHSLVSDDSRATMVSQVEAAIAAGLNELCFTDHIEPHYSDGTPRDPNDWDALIQEFSTVRHQYGDKITVRLGMELGEPPMDIPKVEQMLKTAPPMDFIIGSIHRLSAAYDYVDLHDTRPTTPAQAHGIYQDYLAVVQSMCDWGHFDVLGHITLPLRYCHMRWALTLEQANFDPYRDQVAQIYKTLIDKGLGIELNSTRGDFNCPDQALLQLYRDLGGQRITLGSDAHQPIHVGVGIRDGQALLQSCGFTHFSTFQQGKEIEHPL